MSALMATCRLAFHAFKGKPAIDCDTVKNTWPMMTEEIFIEGEGSCEGERVGGVEGSAVVNTDGLGEEDGKGVGLCVGSLDGRRVRIAEGPRVCLALGFGLGSKVGKGEGPSLGLWWSGRQLVCKSQRIALWT